MTEDAAEMRTVSARELRALTKLASYARHLDACPAAAGHGECLCGLTKAREERSEGRFMTSGIDPDTIIGGDWQR